ncbi:hypothetical protein [Nocardioides aurantiacus]|nr:hypothetical protein [Nocardioides aurantiacus]
MSEYAVHFTKDGAGGTDGYMSMMSILSQGYLKPSGPFGVAAELDFLGSAQKSVCLSEVPLDQLARVVEHRSEYGIGFKQTVLIEKGGARVWYVNEPSLLAEFWRKITAEQGALRDTDAELWRATPFVDLASESALFSRYEWEREWRVPGGLTFKPSDVAFLFIPEALHGAAKSFFIDVKLERLGPHYSCPLLDAAWPEDQLQEAFARVED